MALREINLVPESVLQRRYLLRHGVGWALAYGAVAAVLLGAYVAYTRDIVATHRVTGSEEEVRKRLTGVIVEIEAKKEEIERLAFVRQVSCPFGTAEVFGRLAELMDPKTWLTSASLSVDDGEGYRLSMQGLAYSNARLGATIRALTEDEHFKDVILRNSSEMRRPSGTGGIPADIVQFSIEARVVTE